MAKKAEKARKPTRAERLARARAARRRSDLYARIGVPAIAILIVAGLAVALSMGRGGTGPSASGTVRVEGSAMVPTAQGGSTGQTVPAFSAPALGGGTISWGDYVGKPVVLAVWAPWCPHCQAEMPVIGKVSSEFPEIPVVTVATAIGRQPGPSPEEFMAERKLKFPVAVDDRDGTLANALGVSGFPTTYFVGSDGRTVAAFTGETPADDLRAAFRLLSDRSDK